MPDRADVRPIVYTEIYRKYSEYVYNMVQLAEVYDFFNDDKNMIVNSGWGGDSDWGGNPFDKNDIKKMRSLVKRALHDYPVGRRYVINGIETYERDPNSSNKTKLLESLIVLIKRIALDTKNYIENCTKPMLLKFRSKYKSVYDALRKIDMREKAWPDTEKNRISLERFADLSGKLTQLIGMLFEDPKVSGADVLGDHIGEILTKLGEL